MIPSHLKIAGHPLHPMLVPFPIAFLSGALLMDILYMTTFDGRWYDTAAALLIMGVAGAVAAGAAGLVDYVRAIPATAPAKAIATAHLLSNTVAAVLFAVSLVLHVTGAAQPIPLTVVAVDAVGFLALFAGGWLGGELIYRHHVGIERTIEAAREEPSRRAA
jgi:uncharacterized membrane protein